MSYKKKPLKTFPYPFLQQSFNSYGPHVIENCMKNPPCLRRVLVVC